MFRKRSPSGRESVVAGATLESLIERERAQGYAPGMAALAAWGGLDADHYVVADSKGEAAALPKISALLRSDPHLSAESATAIEEVIRMTYERLREDARRR
jgi:hypothetical protein